METRRGTAGAHPAKKWKTVLLAHQRNESDDYLQRRLCDADPEAFLCVGTVTEDSGGGKLDLRGKYAKTCRKTMKF